MAHLFDDAKVLGTLCKHVHHRATVTLRPALERAMHATPPMVVPATLVVAEGSTAFLVSALPSLGTGTARRSASFTSSSWYFSLVYE
eukprot:CAMPEP_0183365126 /NCGR_PEP_ID=MMETSP0164_2-20130417/83509_1 /TAXON_ID=221442 /ORGANISM="Coccolithus pelagicus ssp braarudi, Strain PLY182g" /LENGTH=86 /DNA_ID=CAMNT_0025540591 /DNA_START=35 /DNA_END=296 /DNA_ORIENTATION=+